MAQLHSSRLYITLRWYYFTLLDSRLLYHDFTSLYLTLHYSTMALIHSTRLYMTLSWLYFTLLDCIYYSTMAVLHSSRLYIIYKGSTSLYWTLHFSNMALLHSTGFYITLPWLYFTLLDST